MKKCIAIILILVLTVAFAGCKGGSNLRTSSNISEDSAISDNSLQEAGVSSESGESSVKDTVSYYDKDPDIDGNDGWNVSNDTATSKDDKDESSNPTSSTPSTSDGTSSDKEECKHTYSKLLLPCSKCGEKRTSIKIIAVGNSFSEDATWYLCDILSAAGFKDVVVANVYKGNCAISDHWGYAKKDEAAYIYQKTTDGYSKFTSTSNAKLSTSLADEDWDAVIMQQRSFDAGRSDKYGNLTNLYNYIKARVPEKAMFYWQLTWAYPEHAPNGTEYTHNNHDGHPQGTEHYAFYLFGCDQMTMYNAICTVAQEKVVPTNLFIGIIPTGTSIQNLRTSQLGDSLNRDNCHLNYKEGRYTAALTWFATFGGNVNSITWTPSTYTSVSTNLNAIKEAVNNAISQPYTVTNSTYKS